MPQAQLESGPHIEEAAVPGHQLLPVAEFGCHDYTGTFETSSEKRVRVSRRNSQLLPKSSEPVQVKKRGTTIAQSDNSCAASLLRSIEPGLDATNSTGKQLHRGIVDGSVDPTSQTGKRCRTSKRQLSLCGSNVEPHPKRQRGRPKSSSIPTNVLPVLLATPATDAYPSQPKKAIGQDNLDTGQSIPTPTNAPKTRCGKRKRGPKSQSQEVLNSNLASTSTTPTRKRGRPKSKRKTRAPTATIGEPLPIAHQMLAIAESCQKCGAKRILYECRTFCCGDGTIVLHTNPYPPQLTYLFTSRDESALHFQKYAWIYNNVFAYSSIGGTIDVQTIKGIYVFKLQGQIYHHVPDLLPRSDTRPRYLQLYFYDGQYEAERRAGCLPELRRNVVDILMQITSTNPYAKFFRSLREINVEENTQIVITKNVRQDLRVYNAPTSDEVAVIWSENSANGDTSSPHIMVTGKTERSHRIMHYYGCYDPLQYPLLFPYGECGWHQGLKKTEDNNIAPTPTRAVSSFIDAEGLLEEETNRILQRRAPGDRHISCREYYCYKFQNRPGNMLLRGGRCFQQYVVDMYVKLENTRLDFYRKNQDTIRAELYQGLLDTVEDGESCAANVGRRIVLPANYIGGPRDMKKRYLNSMSLVQQYGKPDLIVTMTCNANWPEIKRELGLGEEGQNRPDVVARVFRAKLMALKKKIVEEQIFGEVAVGVSVLNNSAITSVI